MKLVCVALFIAVAVSSVSESRVVPLSSQSSLYKAVDKQASSLRGQMLNSVGDLWSDCSKPSDKMVIDSITVSPDPPKKGDTIVIKATVTFKEEVTGGDVKAKLSIDKFPFLAKTLDLCKIVSEAGSSCPIQPGNVTLSLSQQIPSEAPSGNYTGKEYIYDQNNNELGCINLALHF